MSQGRARDGICRGLRNVSQRISCHAVWITEFGRRWEREANRPGRGKQRQALVIGIGDSREFGRQLAPSEKLPSESWEGGQEGEDGLRMRAGGRT